MYRQVRLESDDGLRVQGSGFGVQGFGFRVSSCRFRANACQSIQREVSKGGPLSGPPYSGGSAPLGAAKTKLGNERAILT